MNSNDYKKLVLDTLTQSLKELGFKRKGDVCSFSNGDLTYFISIQRSQTSTPDVLKFTINSEIASTLISKLDDTSLSIAQQRHYNRRIGSYLDHEQDKWWTVDSINSAETAADEIVTLINKKVLPAFSALKKTDDLEAFWKNGGYAGITDEQKRHYLNLLKGGKQE